MSTEMDFKDKQIAQLQKEVRELKAIIAHQNELITALRHQLFGTSSEKSSRINPKSQSTQGNDKGASSSSNHNNASNNDNGDSKKKEPRRRKKTTASAFDSCSSSA
ncbi:MAG: hypothetical protein O2937_03515 [Bacteroidetes bacterium]|nr:hypothetical protein [Bacteroidota bacterium]